MKYQKRKVFKYNKIKIQKKWGNYPYASLTTNSTETHIHSWKGIGGRQDPYADEMKMKLSSQAIVSFTINTD